MSTASSISSLRSLLRPTKVSVMAMILATICGVRVAIYPIIKPLEFFPNGDPVSSLTSPSLILTGTGSLLLDRLVSLEMSSPEMSIGSSK